MRCSGRARGEIQWLSVKFPCPHSCSQENVVTVKCNKNPPPTLVGKSATFCIAAYRLHYKQDRNTTRTHVSPQEWQDSLIWGLTWGQVPQPGDSLLLSTPRITLQGSVDMILNTRKWPLDHILFFFFFFLALKVVGGFFWRDYTLGKKALAAC